MNEITPLVQQLAETYEIEREVGRGGTAIVYVARDIKHSRRVALKVLRPDLAATLAADRFLNEIRIAARLNHPHILPLHDSGRAGDYIYYVTPFVEGETLRNRLDQEKRLPAETVVAITRDIASALSYSHANGVIHRDIKPENILLSADEAIVADFGIAHALEEAGEVRITQTGWAVGTHRYIAPEQALGEIDSRADLYSLGCVMYEMLSGELPARVVTPSRPAAMRRLRLARGTSLPPLPSDVPAPIAAIVARALEPNPENRFANADELLAALAAIPLASNGWRAQNARLGRPLALAGAIGLAGVIAFVFWRPAQLISSGSVAVFPFVVRGSVDTSLVSANGLAELVSGRLTGDVGPGAIDPQIVHQKLSSSERSGRAVISDQRRRSVSRDVGALAAVSGEVFGNGNRLTVTARWYSAEGSGSPTVATKTASADSLVEIIDLVVADLLLKRAGVTPHRLDALLTRHPDALRRYLGGLEAYRRGEYDLASRHFSEALRVDSTFALAALELSSAQGMAGDNGGGDRAFTTAWKLRQHLPARDQLFLRLRVGPRYPEAASPVSEELTAWAKVIDTIPNRWEASWFYGDLLFHEGPRTGNRDAHVLARNLMEQALRADSTLAPALLHAAELAMLAGDTARVLSAAASYLAADPAGEDAPFLRWLVAALSPDRSRVNAFRKTLPQLKREALMRVAGSSQLIPLDLETGAAAAEQRVRNAVETSEFFFARRGIRELLLNRGRPADAQRSGPRPTDNSLSTASTEPFYLVANALFWDGDSVAAARAIATRARAIRAVLEKPDTAGIGAFYDVCGVGLWNIAHNNLDQIDELVRALNARPRTGQRGPNFMQICAATLQADLANRQNRASATIDLERLDSLVSMGWTMNGLTHLAATMTLARLFESQGDEGRALEAVRRRSYKHDGVGLSGLSTLLLAEGRLALRTGDTTGAMKAFNHYLVLRSDPEPGLIPRRDSIRAIVASVERR
jgi:eukaryotic-like serine/threonine-protein kinase